MIGRQRPAASNAARHDPAHGCPEPQAALGGEVAPAKPVTNRSMRAASAKRASPAAGGRCG